MVTVVVTLEAGSEILGLPSPIVRRMRQLITRLSHWPAVSGVKRLKGDLAGHYRLRTGDYRLQFRVEQTKRVVTEKRVVRGKTTVEEREVINVRVIVERAGHRDGFYDE